MSSILWEDPSFFSFDADPTMDISEFFATDELLLSDGCFGMDSTHTIPSPPEMRRSAGAHHHHSTSMSSSGGYHYYPQPPTDGEESREHEGEDHTLGSCCSSSSSTPSQPCSAAEDGSWTKDDTLRLTDLVKFYGLNWQEIAKSFDGRTRSPEACQQQYQILMDYVTKQNQLQLETADESDPSASASPSCEFLFSSPGDGGGCSSIDPFIMQGLDDDNDDEVVMEVGNLGGYAPADMHLHHSAAHYHQASNSMNNASLLEMNPLGAIAGMSMESYMLPSMMDSHHLLQQQQAQQEPAREDAMVPESIPPPTVSRKRKAMSAAGAAKRSSSSKSSSSSTPSSSSKKISSDKAKRKAQRRVEKEKRKEQRRRKREAKRKLKEKKLVAAEKEESTFDLAVDAPTTTTKKKETKKTTKKKSKSKSESSKKKRKSHKSTPKKCEQEEQSPQLQSLLQSLHQQQVQEQGKAVKATSKLEPPCKIAKSSEAKDVASAPKEGTKKTTVTETKANKKKKKSKSKPKTPKVKLESTDVPTNQAPITSPDARSTVPAPAPMTPLTPTTPMASMITMTPMMTTFAPPMSVVYASSAKELSVASSASSPASSKQVSVSLSSPTMMSLVQFQQRAGQPVLTQQRMLYPMLMPRLQSSPLSSETGPMPSSMTMSPSAQASTSTAAPGVPCSVLHPKPTTTTSAAASPSPSNSPLSTTMLTPASFASPSLPMATSPVLAASSSPSAEIPCAVGATSSPALAVAGGGVMAATELHQQAPSLVQATAPGSNAGSAIPAPSGITPMTAGPSSNGAPVLLGRASAITTSACAQLHRAPAGGMMAQASAMAAIPVADAANLKRKKCGDGKPDAASGCAASATGASAPDDAESTSPSAKKRKRRTAAEIERKYKCEMPNCSKSYGSEGALKMHVKLKHPGVKQPAIKSPTCAPTRPNPPSTLPLLLQFPMPFMSNLMGSQQPIFPAPSPGSTAAAMVAAHAAATNTALSSAMASAVTNARAHISTPSQSPLAFAPSSATPASAFMPSLTSLPSSSKPPSTTLMMSAPSSSSPSPSIMSRPTSAFLPASATGRGAHSVAKIPSSFLASTPPPSAFGSFSVIMAPTSSSSPSASSLGQPKAPAPSHFVAAAPIPASRAPSASLAAPSPIKAAAVAAPSVVLPTVISDLQGPSSALSSMTSRLQRLVAPAAASTGTALSKDQLTTALLTCKVEAPDVAEPAQAPSAYSSRSSSPSLESDDISSSTSTSPSSMSPAVSAADLLMDTLGDCMLSLPQAMLMDEESAYDDCCDPSGADHNSVSDTGSALDATASGSNAAASEATATSAQQRERVQADAAVLICHPLRFDGGEFLRQAEAGALLAGDAGVSRPGDATATDAFSYGSSNVHHHPLRSSSDGAFPADGFLRDGLNNDLSSSSSLSQLALDSL